MPQHIISVEQFTPEDLARTFEQAAYFEGAMQDPAKRQDLTSAYVGASAFSSFYEPSTRTRVSCEQAARALGVNVTGTENAEAFSSAAKGETLEDSIQVMDGYGFDVIFLRHHETGSAARAAAVAKHAAIINAGDGKGEHPTQTLLDTYTINQELGRLSGLNVIMGGDLRHGRTVRSLAMELSKHPDNQITFVSTPELQMEQDVLDLLDERGTSYVQTDDMESAFKKDVNVVYWTRLQKERISAGLGITGTGFTITPEMMDLLPKDAILMHPLPRVGEITSAVDDDPRARYFKQAENGLYVRMALLDTILSGTYGPKELRLGPLPKKLFFRLKHELLGAQ